MIPPQIDTVVLLLSLMIVGFLIAIILLEPQWLHIVFNSKGPYQ